MRHRTEAACASPSSGISKSDSSGHGTGESAVWILPRRTLSEVAYVKLQNEEIPEALKISSKDVEPILKTLNLRGRGSDEPDCGTRRDRTVQGGTLRIGNSNTVVAAERMFTTCGVRNPMTSTTVLLRLVGTSSGQQASRGQKGLAVKGIEGNVLYRERDPLSYYPPMADVVF